MWTVAAIFFLADSQSKSVSLVRGSAASSALSHQMNRVNSRNGFAMITAPLISSRLGRWLLLKPCVPFRALTLVVGARHQSSKKPIPLISTGFLPEQVKEEGRFFHRKLISH